ncbi:hypothetical protein FRX31_025050 [Thalictrum thalictroides]|uniref:Uncharacterized protein n=1 Tax=Thalictrum thalictroides TaxID=46969 RepID=A0A7J6VJU3_THATH|nr:hypothetical protein FRX31_025050 [Thalictrum thalictroides]
MMVDSNLAGRQHVAMFSLTRPTNLVARLLHVLYLYTSNMSTVSSLVYKWCEKYGDGNDSGDYNCPARREEGGSDDDDDDGGYDYAPAA